MLAVVSVLCLAPTVDAASIQFQAVDLPDTNPGEDLWQYQYSLDTGAGFTPNNGFTIEFDPKLFSSIDNQSLNEFGTWDMLVLQPDNGLPAPGVFDSLALYDLEGGCCYDFTVNFVWLGGPAVPGSQPFSVYELDQDGFVTVIESGVTPEPAPMELLSTAMGFLVGGRILRRGLL